MGTILTVGVKELKNNLSAYLREVRRGTRILVSDRSTVVAELHEPGAAYPAPGPADPVLSGWIDARIVVPPLRPRESLPPSPVALPEGSALRLLDRGREESGE